MLNVFGAGLLGGGIGVLLGCALGVAHTELAVLGYIIGILVYTCFFGCAELRASSNADSRRQPFYGSTLYPNYGYHYDVRPYYNSGNTLGGTSSFLSGYRYGNVAAKATHFRQQESTLFRTHPFR